jgi:hypothetical protein
MGNLCDCFKSNQILPVYQQQELKKLEKGDYGLTVTIWSTPIEHEFDVRFNFYSKSPELDQLLWKIINYVTINSLKKQISTISIRNQSIIILKRDEVNILKHELDKYKDLDIIWRKFV